MWNNILRTVLLLSLPVAAAYVILVAYVLFFQSRLVYFPNMPGRQLAATPTGIGLDYEAVRITTPDREELHAWYIPAGADAPTVLFCHGNAGNISHRIEWIRIFNEMGLSVLLFDYRGYGLSTGTPSEHGTYLDARAVWDYLVFTRHKKPSRIVVAGESLGGAIASNLAKDVSPAALILVSTFSSAPDLASGIYWFLPVRLLARYHYPTAEYVGKVHAPTLVIHSKADEIVPFAHAQEILRRANHPQQLLEIEGDHNSGLLLSGQAIAEGIERFLVAHDVLDAPAGS